MEELTIKVAEFEGPLDVLLHLIKELKINIYDIPMVELTSQYLSYIHSMQTMQLEVAAEYLVLAATLIEIKARMLLPKTNSSINDEDEMAEDPRKPLVDQLLEYQEIKKAAKELEKRSLERSLYYSKEFSDLTALQENIPLKDGEFTTIDLWKAIEKMTQRQSKKQPIQASLYHEVHTVEELMVDILAKMERETNGELPLEKCFPEWNRHAIVTTFLAVLQLVRDREIDIRQKNPYDAIYITKKGEQTTDER